ncbi:MAG: hypothetical protein EAZ89_00930 [Bacteroidetes bacterium]|nr:MAG: hypothetical protein EAZ89_00930 [Bacteroidota bacterium]
MISSEHSVEQLLLYNRFLGPVLDRFHLHQSSHPLRLDAWKAGNVPDLGFLTEILKAFDDIEGFDAALLQSYPIPVVLDYLYRTHDYYRGQRFNELEQSVERLIRSHSPRYPIFLLLAPVFHHFKQQLFRHIEEEEIRLFPYISYVFLQATYGKVYAQRCFPGLLPCTLSDFAHSHEDHRSEEALEVLISRIREENPDKSISLEVSIFLTQLEALQNDLHIHERVENEVLLPVAMRLEGLTKS